MKKNALRACMALLLAAVPLASCDTTGSGTVVTVWTTIGTANQEVFNQMITAFQAEYPGITINHVTQGGYDTLYSNLTTAIAGGNTPTMAYCYSDHVATYINANNAVLDMTDYMFGEHGFGVDEGWDDITYVADDGQRYTYTNETDFDGFVSEYLEDGHNYVIDGERLDGYYSLPFVRSSEALMYNKTYFEEHDLDTSKLATWSGVWELCAEIIEIENSVDQDNPVFSDATKGQRAPLGYDSSDNMFITFSKLLGIPYTDGEADDPLSWYYAKDSGGKALLSDLNEKYNSLYFFNQSTASSYTSSMFTNENCFMTISSTAGINYCIPDTLNFEVGVAPMPVMDETYATSIMGDIDGWTYNSEDAQVNATMSQGPSFTFFNRHTAEETEAAWLFYKYISGSYWNSVWAGETGYEPVRPDSYEYQPFIDSYDPDDTHASVDNPYQTRQDVARGQIHDLVEQYTEDERMFSSDVFVGSATSRTSVGSLLDGALTYSGEDLDSGLDRLYTDYYSIASQALPL